MALRPALDLLAVRPGFLLVRIQLPWGFGPHLDESNLELGAELFAQVDCVRREFELIWPEKRLQGLHMETIRALRATLELINAQAKVAIPGIHGDLATARAGVGKLTSWQNSYDKCLGAVTKEVVSLSRMYPDLYASLEIPTHLFRRDM